MKSIRNAGIILSLVVAMLMVASILPATAAAAVKLPPAKPTPPAVDRALLAAGKKVYLKQYCGVCHTLAAAGTRGMLGPTHEHIGTTAARRIADPNYKGRARTPAEYIMESIVKPQVYSAPGSGGVRQPMPPFAHLAQADLNAVVYFLAQQK